MPTSGKVIGLILVVVGLVLCLGIGLWGGSYVARGESVSAAIFGLLLGSVIFLPLIGGGIYLMVKGAREAAELAEVEKQRKLLGLVTAQGQVNVADAALELRLNREEIKNAIYDLVSKGLFTGYINWDDGVLYSRQASELKGGKCPNCGGDIKLAGKGVTKCSYCGAEIFL